MKKIRFGLVLGSLLLVNSEARAVSFIDLLYPELDVKFVQNLPLGHLHKNKPRYNKYNWRILETQHFEIYTYETSEEVVTFLVNEAEQTYRDFSEKMRMNVFSEKIKVIIFSSAQDFKESNLIFDFIPDGLGGVTEIEKQKRVLIAFRDSVPGFRHLIRHELTHRYQAEFLQLDVEKIRHGSNGLPLWFMEGSAEYFSSDWTPTSEMLLRRLYLAGNLASLEDPVWVSGAQIYAEGHLAVIYLAECYKEKGDVITELFRKLRYQGFDQALKEVTGDSLGDFQKKFSRYVENRYSALKVAEDITNQIPVFGSQEILLASRDKYFLTKKSVIGRNTLFLNWTDGQNAVSQKIIEDVRLGSAFLRGFEAETDPTFGFQDQGASLGPDNQIVYAIDVGGRDAIRIQKFSFDQKKQRFRLEKAQSYFPDGIRDIQWPIMLNGNEIAFIGRIKVFSEVLVFNRDTGIVRKLSSARVNYRGLTYSPALRLLMSSVENEATGSYDLAVGDLKGGDWQILMPTPENEFYPEFSPDGKRILYVSDKGSAHNIWLYDFEEKTAVKLTDAKIGVFRPKWFTSGGLIFNSFREGDFLIQVAQMPAAAEKEAEKKQNASDFKPVPVEWDSKNELARYLPYGTEVTIMETVVSENGNKVLFAVNRKLSFEDPKPGQEIGFYLLDRPTGKLDFLPFQNLCRLPDFKKPRFLPDNKILLQDGYVYDPETNRLAPLISAALNSSDYDLKISPDQRYLLILAGYPDRLPQITGVSNLFRNKFRYQIEVYDVFSDSALTRKRFGRIIGAEISNDKLVILEESGIFRTHWNLYRFDIDKGNRKLILRRQINLDQLAKRQDFTDFYPLSSLDCFFFATQSRDKPNYYKVWLIDDRENSAATSLVIDDLVVWSGAHLEKDALIINTKNSFGTESVISVTKTSPPAVKTAAMGVAVKKPAYSAVETVRVPDSKFSLSPRSFDLLSTNRTKIKPLPFWPKIYGGQAGGQWDSASGIALLYIDLLALDDLNDQLFYANVYLSQLRYGIADIAYYNFASGNSFAVSYFGTYNSQKLEIGATKNIFLDQFLNWDITAKEQYVNVHRVIDNRRFVREWWQTKIGTTLSLDTTLNDWHGPISGNGIFTAAQAGFGGSGYQSFDLNLDARHHFPLTERLGLALRLAAGRSIGVNPTIFAWGGNQTFRGIPLFSQTGTNYVLQSIDLRIPIFDIIGARVSGPVDEALRYVTVYPDVRGGFYNDLGDMWYEKDSLLPDGHIDFRLQRSTGYFINIPTAFGLIIRFNKGFSGNYGWNIWINQNW